MRYGIDFGHNSPPDTGVRGIRQEDDMTRDVGSRVMRKLIAQGHEVINCTPRRSFSVTNSLAQRTSIANSNRVEVFVSIHFNAFNTRANGTEVFAIGDEGRQIARLVVNEIAKLGFFNRGVKNGSHLFVLRNTSMTAILVEGCFCDNREDMNRYNPEDMANAIVKGLTGKDPNEETGPKDNDKEPNQPLTPSPVVLQFQKDLNKIKIRDGEGKPLEEDGLAGPITMATIRSFQRMVNIQPTGIVGSDTRSAMDQILEQVILRENHPQGPAVRYIQFRIGTDIDGIYGPNTAKAVESFQRANGITADGIVGPETWTLLFG